MTTTYDDDALTPLTRMRKVVHISDVHITNSNKPRITEFFSLIASYYQNSETKPILIITGDICEGDNISSVQSAVESSYEIQTSVARKIFGKMRSLGFEICICPGNHDYPPNGDLNNIRMTYICDNFIKGFYNITGKLSYPIVRSSGKYIFFILDSNAGEFEGAKKEFWDGSLGDVQLGLLRKKLVKVGKGQVVFILLHHHPLSPAPLCLLSDSKKLMKVIRDSNNEADNSVIVAFGHLHKSARKFTKRKYGVKLAISSQSSTAASRCKHFNFIEIIPNVDKDTPDLLTHVQAKIKGEYFEDVTEDSEYEIIKKGNVPNKRGYLPSERCAQFFFCGCF